MNTRSTFFRRVLLFTCGALAGACGDAPPTGSIELAAEEAGTLHRRAERGLEISPVPIDTAGMSPAQKRRVGLGSYIANGTSDCGGCHSSPAGFLAGGNPFTLGPGAGVVFSRNLTPDPATGLRMTEREFIDVIRTGRDIHQDPTKMLLVMPWPIFRWMSDEDLRALYAYLRAVPPASNVVPQDIKLVVVPPSVPFPGFYNDGVQDRRLPPDGSFQFQRGLAVSPEADVRHLRGDRREFGLGSYIVNTMTHCEDCHTNPDRRPDFKINTAAYLTGGAVYAVPPPLQPVLGQVRAMSANLTGAVNGFYAEPGVNYALFRAIMKTGTHADESPPRPLGFPMNIIAANLANLLEDDLHAVFVYESNVPHISGAADIITQDWARYCAADTDCDAGEHCAAATQECAGRACAVDSDCDTCQTCGGGACQAADPLSACVLNAR